MYQLSIRNIKQVIDINNKRMQDKNKSEREMINRKHGRFVLRFEHTCFMSPPLTLWRIFTRNDPARSLGAVTPTTSSLKSSWTRKSLSCSRKNNIRKHTSLSRPHLLQLLQPKVGTLGDHFTWSPQNIRHWGQNLYNSSKYKNKNLWSLLLITKITLTIRIQRGLI